MKTFRQLLIELDACKDSIEWAGEKTVEQFIATCDKGDWIGWLADKMELNQRLLTLAAGHAANTVRHLMKDTCSTEAVDAAIAYGEGRITEDELKVKAERAVWAAWAAYWAAHGAAAFWAARAAWAAYWAARAAYWAAHWAAQAESGAFEKSNSKIADIYREHMGQAIIDKVNQLITEQ